MKILFLNSIGRRKYGGGEKWMVSAAAGLSRAGHSVELAGIGGSRLLARPSAAGIPCHALSAFRLLAFLQSAALFRRTRFDLAVCNLNRDAAIAGRLAGGENGSVIVARHGVPVFAKPKRRYQRLVRQRIDGIVTNTASIKERYEKYGWFDQDFVRVIYNGIEDKSGVRPRDFRSEYPGKTVVFSAGRLAAQKGFPFLIEAADKLRHRSDLQFLVAGKGGDETKLKEAVRKRGIESSFHFIGFLDNPDPAVAGCDVFVLPSLFEGMPNAVMEAMALGKPVILTDVNGARELVEDWKSGIIVPPADADALAKAIEKLADDSLLRSRLGRAAQDRVRQHFTLDAMIGKLEAYFETKILEKRNQSKRG